MIKPESMMTWARAMVANRRATNGDEWTEHQVLWQKKTV